MDGSWILLIMLTAGHKGGVIPLSDYPTVEQCETARGAAMEDWKDRHGPGYRVKLGAECVLSLISDGDE